MSLSLSSRMPQPQHLWGHLTLCLGTEHWDHPEAVRSSECFSLWPGCSELVAVSLLPPQTWLCFLTASALSIPRLFLQAARAGSETPQPLL